MKSQKRWNEKADLDLAPFLLSKSFRFISRIDYIYLRYIQYRTLHRRFYTYNILCKIGIKDTEQCNLCKNGRDSSDHMLINCNISKLLWKNTEKWIRNIGLEEYEFF